MTTRGKISMFLSAKSVFGLSGLMLSLIFCPLSFADDLQAGSGMKTSDQYNGMDHFRIKRDSTSRLYGHIERQKDLPYSHAYRSGQARSDLPVQAGDYVGSVNAFVAPLPAVLRQSNYIWQQSVDGGYYDATGQIKILVMGDQLFRYGGKLSDGTAVPTTPVVCNFKGHVYFPYVVKR